MFCREGEDIDAGTETNANLYHEVYYHFVGTDQSKDILCWKDPENPKYLFGADVTEDGKVGRFCYLPGFYGSVRVMFLFFLLKQYESCT